MRRDDLLAPFLAGVTAPEDRVIGTEYEALVQARATGLTVPYAGPQGIGALLHYLADAYQWERVFEEGHLIALLRAGKSITLEPGGQFEMSGAPLKTLAETKAELDEHLQELEALEEEFPIRFHWRGINPWQDPSQVNWMPKPRYSIMRRYLPTQGDLGLHMMGLTCTVQANLDYTSEADFARKLRVSSGLASLVTALFANSSRMGGQDTGYQSYRAHVWTRVDPDRCGLHRFVFDTDCGFDDYVDWALGVPLFFLVRDGQYRDYAGKATFRDLLEERVEGQRASRKDWDQHMSTLFPDVRARPHIEVRASDCVPPEGIVACPALWKGILYDEDATLAAWDLVKSYGFDERRQLAHDVARDALRTRPPRGRGTIQDRCRDLVEIATIGLRKQADAGLGAVEDVELLEPLRRIVTTGRTYAMEQTEDD